MLPHRSILILITCVTCLSFAPSLGKSEPAIARSKVDSSSPRQVPQAKPVATAPPVLERGSRGQAVTELQTKLKQLGYYVDTADGVYGESTEFAVFKFQKSVGLKPDGIAGSTTWDRIQTAPVEKKAPSPTTVPQKPAKSRFGGINPWLIVGFLATAAGVLVGLFFLLRWFGKSSQEVEPEPEESDSLLKHSNVFQSTHDSAIKTGSPADTPHLDNSKNGYAGEPRLATDNQESNRPFNHTLLPPSHLSPSSASESTEGTPTDGRAIEKTTRLAKINIVDELIQELGSLDPAKRRKAIWELAQLGDSRAIQPLVELIVDSDSQQRSLILEAVSQIGVRTLKPMNRALAISLQDESPQVRKNAIRDLTLVYDMITQINYLLRHALEDPDSEVKETGKWALEQLNRIRTSSGIDSFSESPNPERSSDKPPNEPGQ